jgi:hypothetical protein
MTHRLHVHINKMLRGPTLLSNMIIASTLETGGLVATIIFGLRNTFSRMEVPTWVFGSPGLALA